MIILLAVVLLLFLIILVLYLRNRYLKKYFSQAKTSEQKYKDMYYLLNDWLSIRQNGLTLFDWFEKRDYKNVAIYGMGELGECLFKELKGHEDKIVIKYGVDMYANQARTELFVYFPSEELPDADVMIVTPFMYYDAIKRAMETKTKAEIISLEEVIYDVLVESEQRLGSRG